MCTMTKLSMAAEAIFGSVCWTTLSYAMYGSALGVHSAGLVHVDAQRGRQVLTNNL